MSFYTSREDKPRWLVKEFPSLFQDARSVLDVGCDRGQLAQLLPSHIAYTGIDMNEEADIQCNLDSGQRLPLSDKSYDLVLCLETLEHLEHIHVVLDELFRISSKYILITLPNPLSRIFHSYLRGRKRTQDPEQQKQFGAYMKFYGLPFERPFDRHRWFFSTDESISFIRYHAEASNWNIKELRYSLDMKGGFRRYLKFAISAFRRKRMYNLFNETTIFLLERNTTP